jgi:hypothetical protein
MKSNGTPFQHDPSISDRCGGGWWCGGFYKRGEEGICAISDEKMGFGYFHFIMRIFICFEYEQHQRQLVMHNNKMSVGIGSVQ